MIVIIHGEHTIASRNYLQSVKLQIKVPIVLDGKTVTLTDLVQVLDGGGLFNDTKHIIIEDLLSRSASKETSDIISYLQKMQEHDITLWEGKEISKKNLSPFKNATIKLFNPPKEIFSFLDTLKPKNTQSIVTFHNILKFEDAEFVFYMLVRQFRLLLALDALNRDEQIDEVKRLAPWQIGKLKRQAGLFPKDTLKNAYKKLFAIDLSTKTGTTPLSLTQAIDFFLLDL